MLMMTLSSSSKYSLRFDHCMYVVDIKTTTTIEPNHKPYLLQDFFSSIELGLQTPEGLRSIHFTKDRNDSISLILD